jgi:DNA-binding transcriptional LysR family regulator
MRAPRSPVARLVVCIVAADHPRIQATLDFDTFVNESHVLLSFGRSYEPSLAERYVEGLVAERNARRKVVVYAPSSTVVPTLVTSRDLLALVPKPLAEREAARLPLRIFAPPFALPPQHISMVWHARTQNDPAHRCLGISCASSGDVNRSPAVARGFATGSNLRIDHLSVTLAQAVLTAVD